MTWKIDKIALIIIKNAQVLRPRSNGKSKYYFPGGKRELNESDEQTLIREIRVELSVEIVPNSSKYIGAFTAQSDGMKKGILVKMTCSSIDFRGTLKPNNEIEEIKWVNYADINTVSAVDKIIFDFLKVKGELE